MDTKIKNINNIQQKLSSWYNLKALCSLLFLALFSFNLSAQIVIDGQTNDWSGQAYNAYSHDANSSNDNQFTQGSKDEMQISGWNWSNGSTNNKGDITNGAAILGTEMVSGQPHNILYFAGDRFVNNGDAAIGFWFFRSAVSLLGTTAGTFSGTHTNGDLLVVSHFTQGGGQATIFIYVWNNGVLTGPTTSSAAAVNSAVQQVPTGFTYHSANYPIGDFFEGKLDLTALNIPPCFANFLLETRNSQSINASLQDLTFGSFTTSVPPPGVTPAARCGNGSVTLQASGCTGGTLNWYDAPTGGNLVNTGTSYTLNITETKTFYVSCTTADGCVSARTAVTATFNSNPTVVADATPAGNVNIGATPPHYSLSTTVNGVLSNSGFNYSWVQDPPEGATTGTLSATNIANPTFTANIAQDFTWTVTATDKITGCFNSDDVDRTIDPVAGCPNVPVQPVCAGTTHTYTADAGPAATETWVWSVNNGASINVNPPNGGSSISVTAGSQSFTLTLTKSFDNESLADVVCEYPITVNPLAAPPNVTYIPPTCTETTFSVQITNPEVGSTYEVTQLDGNVVTTAPYVSGALVIGDLHLGQGYSVVSTTSAGCESNPNQCGFTSQRGAKPITQVNIVNEIIEKPTVVAFPNPFSDKIKFSIKAPMAGQGSLELYNMLGQKVKIIYQGHIEKGLQNFEYNVPGPQRANLIYLFRVGNFRTTGKLVGIK